MMAFIIAAVLAVLFSVLNSFSGIEDWMNEADFKDLEEIV